MQVHSYLSENIFDAKDIKYNVPWNYVIEDVNSSVITNHFMNKNCRKLVQRVVLNHFGHTWPHPREIIEKICHFYGCLTTCKKSTSCLNLFLRWSSLTIWHHFGHALMCLNKTSLKVWVNLSKFITSLVACSYTKN